MPVEFFLNLSNSYPEVNENPLEESKDYEDRPVIQSVYEEEVQRAFIKYR